MEKARDTYLLREIERIERIAEATADMELCAELSAAGAYVRGLLRKLGDWESRATRALLVERLMGRTTEEIRQHLAAMDDQELPWD